MGRPKGSKNNSTQKKDISPVKTQLKIDPVIETESKDQVKKTCAIFKLEVNVGREQLLSIDNIHPLKKKDENGFVIYECPAITHAYGIKGLANYGVYSKMTFEKDTGVLNVWTLCGNDPEPNYKIVGF